MDGRMHVALGIEGSVDGECGGGGGGGVFLGGGGGGGGGGVLAVLWHTGSLESHVTVSLL